MKKLLLMFAMVFAGIVTAAAQSSNAYAYISDVSYSGTDITVYVELTDMAKANYESVTLQIRPANSIDGLIVDQYKRIVVYDDGAVFFSCVRGGDASDACRSYQWNITVVDKKEK